MARAPRIDIPGYPQHLIVRGNNRCAMFVDDRDYCVFIRHLQDALLKSESALHAYVLMPNHVHMLATGTREGSLSAMIQAVGRRYARYANKRQQRTGTLFEGRFRSSLIESERYLLACMRYIELNPVRASIVPEPADFHWSSHRQNASGMPAGMVTAHDIYLRLGRDSSERAAAYRGLFAEQMPPTVLAEIRATSIAGSPLGSFDFRRNLQLAAA